MPRLEIAKKCRFCTYSDPKPNQPSQRRQPGYTKLHRRLSNSCPRCGPKRHVSPAKSEWADSASDRAWVASAFCDDGGFSGCMGLRIASMNWNSQGDVV